MMKEPGKNPETAEFSRPAILECVLDESTLVMDSGAVRVIYGADPEMGYNIHLCRRNMYGTVVVCAMERGRLRDLDASEITVWRATLRHCEKMARLLAEREKDTSSGASRHLPLEGEG